MKNGWGRYVKSWNAPMTQTYQYEVLGTLRFIAKYIYEGEIVEPKVDRLKWQTTLKSES